MNKIMWSSLYSTWIGSPEHDYIHVHSFSVLILQGQCKLLYVRCLFGLLCSSLQPPCRYICLPICHWTFVPHHWDYTASRLTAVTALYWIFTYGPRLDREWNNVTGVNKLVFEHNFEMLCTASMFAVHAVWMFCSIMLLLWPLFITIDAIFMAYWNRSVGIQ